MIRHLTAFAWLRWRLLVNGVAGASRRDRTERLSRAAALAAPALIAALSLAAAALLGWVGFAAGAALGRGASEPASILLVLRAVLVTALVVLVAAPLAAATQGAMSGHVRLLLLPVSRAALHLADLATGTTAPWLAPIVPGLALLAVGLWVAGAAATAVVTAAAGAALVVVLASLGSLSSSLVSRLMRNRRRAELFTLLFVLLLSVGSWLPALATSAWDAKGDAPSGGRRQGLEQVERLDQAVTTWSVWLPTELYGRAIAASLDRRPLLAWSLVGVLGLEALVVFAASAHAHRALLDAAESGGARRPPAHAFRPMSRLPGLSPAASAVATVFARTALRSVRGRLAVLMPGPVVASLGLVSRLTPGDFPGGSVLGGSGAVMLGTGIFFGLYALEAFTLNQFASDRGGLTLQWLLPVSDEDLVRGKAVGGALIVAPLVALCTGCALLVSPSGSALEWLAVLVGSFATYLLASPFAAWLSALFPVVADLSKTGSGGNPHGAAMLAGTLLMAVLSLPPTLTVVVVGHLLHRPGLAFGLVAVWAAIAVAVSMPLLTSAARTLGPRRENLALVAEGR